MTGGLGHLVVAAVLLVTGAFGQVRVSQFDMQPPPYVMEPYELAVNPGNGEIYVTGSSPGVLVIGRPGLRPEGLIAAGTHLRHPTYCPAGNKLYVYTWWDSVIVVVDCGTRSVLGSVPMDRTPDVLMYTGETNRLLAAIGARSSYPAQLLVLDCAADSLVDSIALDSLDEPEALGYNPTTDRLYWATYRDRLATVDLGTGSARRLDYEAYDVAVNAAGTKVWLACLDSIAVLDAATDSLLAWVDVDTAWGDIEQLVYNPMYDKVYGTGYDDYDVYRVVVIDGIGDTLVAAIESDDCFTGPAALTGDDRYLCQLGFALDSVGFAVIDCERDSVVAVLGLNWYEGTLASVPGRPEVLFAGYQGIIVTADCEACVVAETLVTTDVYKPCELEFDAGRDRLYCHCGRRPDEQLLLVADVEPSTGRIFRFLPGIVGPDGMFCSPNQDRLYLQSDDELTAVDLATGQSRVVPGPLDIVQVIGGSQTRDRFYCIGEEHGDYRLLGLQGMGSVQDAVGLPGPPAATYFDAASERVYLAFESGLLSRLLFWQEGEDTLSAAVQLPVDVSVLQRGGDRLFGIGEDLIVVLDIEPWGSEPATAFCGHFDEGCGLSCNEDGTKLCYVDNGTLVLVDLARPDFGRRIPLGDIDALIRFPGSGHLLCFGDDEVTVVDIERDSVLQQAWLESDVWTMAVDTAGRRVYFALGYRAVTMVEYDFEPALIEPGPESFIASASVGVAGHTRYWVYDTNGRRLMRLLPGENDVSHLPNGVYFARPMSAGPPVRKLVIRR